MFCSKQAMLGLSKSISGFDPRSIVGCRLWLDGADPLAGALPSNGATVSTWYDKSGNGYNAPATVSGATFTAASQNGNGYITFPTGKYFTTSNFILSSTNTPTIFLVCQQTGYGSGNSDIISASTGTPYSYYTLDIYGNSGTKNLAVNMWSNVNVNGNISIANPTVISIVGSGSPTYSVTMWGNGTSNVTFTGYASNPLSTSNSFWIGAISAGFIGNIYEVLFYDTAFTSSQRQSIEGYLAWKWGLQVQTPVAPVLTPLSVPGCQLWLDAADKTKIAPSAGGTLTSWTDKSGTGKTVTVASAPTYSLTAFNGLPCLTFASGNSLTIPITAPGTNDIAIFAVWKLTDGTASRDIFSIGAPGGSETAIGWNSSAANYLMYRYGGAQSTAPTSYSSNITIVQSGTQVSGYRTVYINGTSPSTTGTETYNQTNTTAYIGGGGFPLIGQVAEIIYYQATLSTTQRQSIENYLMGKWGIKPSLPATHPFYSLPAFSRPFGPTDIPGCALWLDAADASTVVLGTGSNISQWRDKSGNGIYASPSNGASGVIPTYSNSAVYINNGGSATYNSSTYTCLAINSNFQLGTSFTLFAVFNFTTTTGYQSIYQNSRGTNAGGTILSVGNTQILEFGADQTTQRNISSGQGFTNFGTTRSVVSFHSTPASLYLYQNGSVLASNVTAATLPTTDVGPFPNIGGGYTDNRWGTGYFNEIICYTAELTTTQRQSVEGYLAAKWGLLNNLPGKTLSPLNIPGCALWYDAADASSITLNGSTVSQWSDKSGNGNHLTQGTTSAQPTYGTYLSYPGVYFNGANTQVLSTTYNQTGTGGRNTFIVFYDISTSPNIYGDPGLMYMGGSGAVGSAWRTQYIATSNALCVDIGAGVKIMTTSPNVTSMRTTRCVAMWAAPNSATVATTYVYGNGTQFTVQGANSGGLTTAVNTVGGLGTTIGKFTTSVISEILHYSTELTASQRQSVENYLMSKWGISNVTTHPFKSIPPSTSQPPQFQEVTPGNWTRDWQPYLQRLVAANSGATASISSYSVSGSTASYPRGYGAIAPNGFLYFIGGSGVFVVNPSTNTATIIGSTDTTQYSGLVLGTNGNLYGIPYGSGTVLLITPSSSSPYGTVTTIGSALDSYQGGCLGPNGTIYALPWVGSNLLTINGNTVTQIAISPRTTTRGSVLGPDGNIYGAPWGTSLILKINPATNTSSTIACNGNTYWGASLAPNGLIYFSPFDPGSFLCLNVVGNIVTNVGSSGTYYCGEVLGPNGKLYSAPYNGSILEYNTATNSTATYSIPLVLNGTSMILAPNGNIYVGGTTSTNGYYISFSGLSQTPSSNYCLSAYTNKF